MSRVVVDNENLKILHLLETFACLPAEGLFSYFKLHCEVKCAAFAAFAFHPNASPQHVHDTMGNGEAQAGAAVLARI